MFVGNKLREEEVLSSWSVLLGKILYNRLRRSFGYFFFTKIFVGLDESIFSVLYSTKHSAPNSPVNRLLSALLLLHRYNWSYNELMNQLSYNIEIRLALGLSDLESLPFSRRTLFLFKARLSDYEAATKINLLQVFFDSLTKKQLEELGIRECIQRGDSVQLQSNIRRYGRVGLLVEVLRRLYKVLSKADQQLYASLFKPYLKGGESYVYELKSGELAKELTTLGLVYYHLATTLKEVYGSTLTFGIFKRVYGEHFDLLEHPKEGANGEKIGIKVKSSQDLGSDCLQSPDDLEATYRKKREEEYQGYIGVGVETCHPANEINLVTKLVVAKNNEDDGKVLAKELDELKEQTPTLNELHLDGGFGCELLDKKAGEHDIMIVQTAIRGRPPQVPMRIESYEDRRLRRNRLSSQLPK